MLIRLSTDLEQALRARATALGMDPSEVARRALRRHRRNTCNANAHRAGVTRDGSAPVRLDLGETAAGLTAAEVRAALAWQLRATEHLVTWHVAEYALVDGE